MPMVRTAITNDGTPDNNETFKLNATNTGNTTGSGTATIAAGNHTLTVEVDGAAPYFKAQCDDASFLGD